MSPEFPDEMRPCPITPSRAPCTLAHVHELHGGDPAWPLTEQYEKMVLSGPAPPWEKTRALLIAKGAKHA